MDEKYCAQISDGVVTQVIVCGSAAWASQTFGGEWVYCGAQLVGLGYLYEHGIFSVPPSEQLYGFVPESDSQTKGWMARIAAWLWGSSR